jgi:hypothetical protein
VQTATPPTITDLERGGGFYALLFFGFWVGVGVFWLMRQAVTIMREQNERQIAMMDKQITEGREQVASLISAFEHSLELHEAQTKTRVPKRRA